MAEHSRHHRPSVALKKVLLFLAGSLTVLLCCVPLSSSEQSDIVTNGEPVTLVLQWNHQSQFAGYYMAHAKGIYEAAGLDVRIVRGGPDVRAGNMLRQESADFASIMLPTAIEARAAGVPLVQLSQIVNRGNFVIVAWRQPVNGPPIHSLSDLEGTPVTIWLEDFRTPYLALFASRRVRPIILPQYATLSLFIRGGAAACSAMRYNEYHTLLQAGIEESDLLVFDLHELGITMPEDGIYALEDTWRRRPAVCRRFVQASLDGWRYARDHEEETLDVVMDYIFRDNLPANRAHMRWMLRTILSSIFPSTDDSWVFGRLSRKAYETTEHLMLNYGSLKRSITFDEMNVEEAVHERP